MNLKLFGLVLAAVAATAAGPATAGLDMAKKYNCTACHAVDKKIVGPSYQDVAAKHKGEGAAAVPKLVDKVKKGGAGVYGPIPMPPNPAVPDADAKALVEWILAGAK